MAAGAKPHGSRSVYDRKRGSRSSAVRRWDTTARSASMAQPVCSKRV